MVAKISMGSSLYGALAYNGEKINEGEGKLLATNKIFDDGNGRLDIVQALMDFQMYMPSHIRCEKPVAHISLNPHPEDKLDDNDLTCIAQEYLEKLGYGSQPFVVFKHEDIDRHHIHIVTINVDENGKKINDSFQKRRSKRITDDIEKSHNLHPSSYQGTDLKGELKKVLAEDGNIKRQMGNILKSLSKYRFASMGEYRALLSLYNISVEEVRGKIKEKEYRGIIYSAVNDKGEKVGNPIKSSRFGKEVGFVALSEKMELSKLDIKDKKLTSPTKKVLDAAIKFTHDRERFVSLLKKNGIDVILRTTDTGRIYGATFIDHNSQCVLNGSRLGKEYSANALEVLLTSTDNNNEQGQAIFDSTRQATNSSFNALESNVDNNAENNGENQENTFEDDTSLGLSLFETHGTDPEEERFRKRIQRKKIKGIRR